MERSIIFLREYGIFVLLVLVGVGIVAYGVADVVIPPEVTVEIVSDKNEENTYEIVVDVAGYVEKPGVYKLGKGARIGDAIVAAGGLSLEADREWIAQTLNLAKEIKDGEKIYIPALKSQIIYSQNSSDLNVLNAKLININTASITELDKLEGIGEVRAQTIVANRPYTHIEELISKAKLSESVYEKIKDLVAVY